MRFMLIVTILLGLLFIYQLGRHLLGGSWGPDALSTTIIGILTATLMTFGVVLGKMSMKQHYEFRSIHGELKRMHASLSGQISLIDGQVNQMDRRLVRVEHAVEKR